jgi:hypothetical protein
MKERVVEKTMATRGSLMVLLSLVIIPLLSLTVSSQESPIPGVVLDCDDLAPKMIVHPERLAPVTINCTLENSSLYKEEIKLESEVFGNGFAISLSPAGPHEVESGETVEVAVTFAGSARMDAESIDFDLMATVMTITIVTDPINVPWSGAPGATSNKSGTISSEVYHKVVLDMNDKSARDIAPGVEEKLTFSLINDGNAVDTFEVGINEEGITALENAGFRFPGDSSMTFTLSKGSMENNNISIIAPDSVTVALTIEIMLEAKSLLDSDMTNFESISLTIKVEKTSGVGGIDALSSLSDDEVKIYSAFGGGILILLLLVIAISKITKKGNKHDKKNYVEESPIDVVEDVAANPVDEFDFEDLDLDDIDDDLSDLDDIDEFDFEDI